MTALSVKSSSSFSVATPYLSRKVVGARLNRNAAIKSNHLTTLASQIKAGGSFTANAGVGPKADPHARILIEGVKEKTIESHTEQDENTMWQSMSGQGSTKESLALVKIDAKATKFSAPGGISVQLPASDNFRQQIEALQQEPGMGWLSDIAQRKDVNWQQVKLSYDSWNYSHEGLSQTGAILIAIAVAAATAGTASGLSATLVAGAGLTGTGASIATAAIAAGMTSLASQAAVALINNQGDIGKTLQTLGSESSIRKTVATMATAGALQGLGDALSFSQNPTYNGMSGNGSLVNSTSGVATDQFVNQLGTNLSKNIANNLTGSLINSAITGQPLNEQSLQNALTSALITTGIAQGANSIGGAASRGPNGEPPTLNTFTQAVAHAILGCAGGAAAAGNSSGCGAGALGGVVGELTAKFAANNDLSPDSAVALAKVMSATAGLLVSGGDPTLVNVAATMGANAVENNYLTNGRFITADESQKVLDATGRWDGTSYRLVGSNSEIQIAGDCSGITYKSFSEAGYGYSYVRADEFPKAAAKEGFPFASVDRVAMQPGDVLYFSGHLAIYLGVNERGQQLMWTASTSQGKYMKQSISGFEKSKPLLGVYRAQVEQ